jgi:hypothetical protein
MFENMDKKGRGLLIRQILVITCGLMITYLGFIYSNKYIIAIGLYAVLTGIISFFKSALWFRIIGVILFLSLGSMFVKDKEIFSAVLIFIVATFEIVKLLLFDYSYKALYLSNENEDIDKDDIDEDVPDQSNQQPD